MGAPVDPAFPCSIVITIPFPTPRLAAVALQALRVDKELSRLVCRNLSTAAAASMDSETILRAEYKATTNRMLRVAVNAFMDSVALVLDVMEALDVDVFQNRSGKQ